MSSNRRRARDAATAALASAMTVLAVASGGSAEPAGALAVPRNESPPTISGTQRVGSTLTAQPGRWSGTAPITFTYRWVRCNAQLANCVNTGVRSRRYNLRSADLNRRLVVVVTGRNSEGSSDASASTGVIRERATRPSNVIAPTIGGTAREGEVLTANPGTWTGTAPITFTYQWQRCDANGGACAAISGATARTYAVTSGDVGRSLRVRVTARNAAGTRSLTTPPTAAVQPGGPGGQIRLPDGRISVPVESVALPARLVIDDVRFSPNPVRSRTRPITIRVHVSDTRGFVVRGALVFARSTPLLTTVPPETATATDGWATLTVRPRRPLPGLVFPLRRGLNVQFYVQARKAGERLLFGVTGTRLVQVRTSR
jgi:hypothetical protein